MIITENLPEWDSMGLLPPIWPEEAGDSPSRSPYPVDLVTFVEYFATSPKRITILGGLLKFRKELHKLNIVSGFQWLDGSFLERIEIREHRAPRDIDVVTFFYLPDDENQQELSRKNRKLFSAKQLKKDYSVDGHFMVLGKPVNAKEVKKISYWYSMWSHCRDELWKGFAQVNLDPQQDVEAQKVLKIAKESDHE